MLTHKVSRALWSKIAVASSDWLEQNTTLIARSAMLIYRTCGREEARAYLALVRASMLSEHKHEESR